MEANISISTTALRVEIFETIEHFEVHERNCREFNFAVYRFEHKMRKLNLRRS
jgi:hypothetical protein